MIQFVPMTHPQSNMKQTPQWLLPAPQVGEAGHKWKWQGKNKIKKPNTLSPISHHDDASQKKIQKLKAF